MKRRQATGRKKKQGRSKDCGCGNSRWLIMSVGMGMAIKEGVGNNRNRDRNKINQETDGREGDKAFRSHAIPSAIQSTSICPLQFSSDPQTARVDDPSQCAAAVQRSLVSSQVQSYCIMHAYGASLYEQTSCENPLISPWRRGHRKQNNEINNPKPAGKSRP